MSGSKVEIKLPNGKVIEGSIISLCAEPRVIKTEEGNNFINHLEGYDYLYEIEAICFIPNEKELLQ